MIDNYFTTGKAAQAFLKRNVRNWQDGQVVVDKAAYGEFKIIIALNRQLKVVKTRSERFDDLIVKLEDYFDGKDWDDHSYAEICSNVNGQNYVIKSPVFQCAENDKMPNSRIALFREWRKKIDPTVGIIRVPRPRNFAIYKPGELTKAYAEDRAPEPKKIYK